MAKDTNVILKGVAKVPPPTLPVHPGSTVHRPAPYSGCAQVQVLQRGHITRVCHAPTSEATVWLWSCWTVVSSASVYNKFLFTC